ncbi:MULTISPECIES: PilZ domain-containing protein [unclassified Motilimonas]|uniref:PilZ domain-containing protein n=1 Tax=Motilimonas TaxID=1914248 RepID=UPI001E32D858|nr:MULTISPECIES: PilZ domain-containing protein [unclassified Motilimonas]MCE0557933.1 PilZ domain-containing protein [Motilimonas sp. E26]MDO6524737.1 PilZ domain-containing protein [Motilimonas sp. 1_MG-2023]
MDTESYFSVTHPLTVNIEPLAKNDTVPNADELVRHMPASFQIASEIAQVDANSLRFLNQLGEQTQDLVNYLSLQSKKINMLLCHMMAQEDEIQYRHHTLAFGGGGIRYLHSQAMEVGQFASLKIFLVDEAAAVFCYGQVSQCQAVEQGYEIEMHFASIRETDRDVLIKASLHIQSKQLKRRAELRQEQN